MALVLRFGLAVEALIWGIPFLIQPLSAVFYPLDVLPAWIRPVSLALPSTHVFEGMRHALQTGGVSAGSLVAALAMNAVWLAAGALFFRHMFDQVRRRGLLARLGMA